MTMPDMSHIRETQSKRTAVQVAAMTVGIVFVLVGLMGFIPGLTSHYDKLDWAGHHSGAMLLGIFAVSALHNIVHLVFGVAGLALARSYRGARAYLIGGGIVYAALWLYGLLIDREAAMNFVPVNTADNWLHLGLAVAMISLGLLLGRYAIHTGHPSGRQ